MNRCWSAIANEIITKKLAPNYESLIFTRADNKATSVVTSQGYIIRGGYVAKVKKIKMSYEEIN